MQFRETISVAIDALRSKQTARDADVYGGDHRQRVDRAGGDRGADQPEVTSFRRLRPVGSNLVWAEMVKTPEKMPAAEPSLNAGRPRGGERNHPGVATAAGFTDMPMTVVVSGVTRPVSLIGVTDGYQQIRRLVILRGRYFDSAKIRKRTAKFA